jgi:NADPH-dependent 2,4-dienoyl-CoA reductase/sulfur reductase-like enzyme/predicted ArsR family transcriptional regulator
VFLRKPDAYRELDVEWLGGRRVVGADPGRRSVALDDGGSLPFDTLVLATGGSPRRLPDVPRVSNVTALRTLDDGVGLKALLDASRRLLIIGAGFIGAEVAASTRALGRDVLLVEAAPVPLGRALGEEMGHLYGMIHREHGVDLRTGTTVRTWHVRGDRVVGVELDDGATEDVDGVLVAVGIQPDLTLVRQLGLSTGEGGVFVDERLQAGDGIYTVGDLAAHFHPTFQRYLRVEHWQVARKQGEAVGRLIAGRGEGGTYDEIPWFWSDQYDVKLQYLGHAAGFDEAVWRGDRDGGRFSVFYLRERVLEAVLAVNDARTIRFSRELIRRRRPVDAAALASDPPTSGSSPRCEARADVRARDDDEVMSARDAAARAAARAAVTVLGEGVRRRLFEIVRSAHRPVNREEAAARAGISRRLAAFHLDKLVAAGLLRARYQSPPGIPRKVGRTPKVYEGDDIEVQISIPRREHGALADILVDAVLTEKRGESAAQAALRVALERGKELGRTVRDGACQGERGFATAEQVLRGQGFEPYRHGPAALRLRNCPFHPLSAKSPGLVCAMNHAYLAGVLEGMEAEALQAFLEPRAGECCVELRRTAT